MLILTKMFNIGQMPDLIVRSKRSLLVSDVCHMPSQP